MKFIIKIMKEKHIIQLLYWSKLDVGHCICAMYVYGIVCNSLIGSLINIVCNSLIDSLINITYDKILFKC